MQTAQSRILKLKNIVGYFLSCKTHTHVFMDIIQFKLPQTPVKFYTSICSNTIMNKLKHFFFCLIFSSQPRYQRKTEIRHPSPSDLRIQTFNF